MADVQNTPFLMIPHEWLEALVAFRRLSALHQGLLLTILHETWGKGRDEAAIGTALFRKRAWGADRKAVTRGIQRLTELNVVRVTGVEDDGTKKYAPVRDYEEWEWEDDERYRVQALAHHYATRVYPAIAAKRRQRTYREETYAVCGALDDALRKVNESCDLPEGESPTWHEWMAAIEGVLDRYDAETLINAISWIPYMDWWKQRISGNNAGRRFAQHIDEIVPAAQATVAKKQRGRR